ncbi:hypothetical protein I3842_01G075900 [Carya illinoinensis]|uniref:Aluminum-activated malate transporter 10 n=1 Tax=Carya illinoinensis TaxID=32201 RepID=A0A922FXR4_CARIL|nr:hypothetical protein I3842_01G075900 [Carya illinoinensis]
MVKENEVSEKLEWRINFPDRKSKLLVPESGILDKTSVGLEGLLGRFISMVLRFLENAWNLGVAEPKKVIHGVKVGLTLFIVSLFYYMKPLYDGLGGNAMWAIMTVVVVFESNVGATLYKCVNRVIGTFLAGSLALGVQWIACKSGESFEPIVIGVSVFFLASAATFSRFIPSVKTHFDYGTMIFILTFSLVSVSGYREEEVFQLGHQRLSTIAIGTSLCIIITIIVYPIWSGTELHLLIFRNLGKLADSLEGCVTEYFEEDKTVPESEKDGRKRILQGYKCVLNSKGTEESMAKLALWEPGHDRFNFRHPWKQYLKVGAAMRNCAYCVEALNGSVNLKNQAPEHLKKHLRDACMALCSCSSYVLKELALTVENTTKSSKIDFLVGEMNFAVQELEDALKSVPNSVTEPTVLSTLEAPINEANREPKTTIPLIMEFLPLATLVSLLIEIAARVEEIANAVDQLAGLAKFEKANQKKPTEEPTSDAQDHKI